MGGGAVIQGGSPSHLKVWVVFWAHHGARIPTMPLGQNQIRCPWTRGGVVRFFKKNSVLSCIVSTLAVAIMQWKET